MKAVKLVCFLLGITITATAQTSIQQQKLTTLATSFINLYNTGDSLAYRQFLSPLAADTNQLRDLLWRYRNTYQTLGKVAVRKIITRSPTTVEAWVQENKFESWWKFSIYTDSVQQFQRRTVEPANFTSDFVKTGKLTDKQLADETEGYITQKLGNNFSGNVLILKEGKEIYSRSFGTNWEGKPNTRSQSFNLASMGKLFTAISILQLADAHRLSLEDTIGSLLPGLKNKALEAITVRQLLTHTSGMGDFFESPLYRQMMDSLHLSPTELSERVLQHNADYLRFVEADRLLFAPGKGWAYSNTGYALLGLLVEKITGTAFEKYVQQNIFYKAGMKTAVAGQGPGGGMATVDDLSRFAKALMSNQLLSAKTTAEMLSYTGNGKYGYGTEHHLLGREHIVGHSGGFERVCTELNMYTKNKTVVIILSNSNPPFGHFLSSKLKELLVRN